MEAPRNISSPITLKWYHSVRAKFFFTFSGLIAIIAICIFLYFPAQLQNQALAVTKDQAASFADFMAFSLSPAIFFDDPVSAEEVMEAVKVNKMVAFVKVIGKKGEVFAAYGETSKAREVMQTQEADHLSENGDLWLSASPVMHQDVEIGRVIVGHSLDKMKADVQASKRLIGIISIATFLLGVGFVYWVSSLFTRNLTNIVTVVNQIGKGDFSQRATVASQDEVGILARSFNGMVSELELSTAALRKREQQFRNLAESMNEGLLQMDGNLSIRYVNPRVCKMLQVNENDLIGKHFKAITGETNLPDFLSEEAESKVELQLKDQNGQSLWILLSYSNSIDILGNLSITAIFTDITLLKKTEDDLVYKNRELDTFVYKASHDLKAPLSSLRGLVDIVLEELQDEQARRFLGLIDRTVSKMDDVLQGLLEVTWIKQGALEASSIHLSDLVQTILRSIAHAPGYETVEFRMDIPKSYHLFSDEKMLNSILQNIIFNAIKYHRDAEEGEPKWVAVTVTDFSKHVRISIKDNGPGIPQASQEKLFDMFYRASTKSQGSGLGLYIVKTSIEKMGGTVTLNSEVGRGTEFVLELPKMEIPVKFQEDEQRHNSYF